MTNIKNLGQVFTPTFVVSKLLSLRQNYGSILEPSAGNGSFLSCLEDRAIGIEIDQSLCSDNRIINVDFFQYPTSHKFDTIIGNPPYVRYQDILATTKARLSDKFNQRTNLFIYFIDKCLNHLNEGGELILITPRDFIKLTSSIPLNQRLFREGTITDFHDLGDQPIFAGFTPNCAIWRWQKGLFNRQMNSGQTFYENKGQILFDSPTTNCLSDWFDVKVGAVSGADAIFTHAEGISLVCSKTRKNGEYRKMIYNQPHPHLIQYKAVLLERKIRSFNESNYWQWGRKYYQSERQRIYVNCKTRHDQPFFIDKNPAYDGSVLALLPKTKMNLEAAVRHLNKQKWNQLGFKCGGRYIFSQKSLENLSINL